ncbi:MAG: serine hydrolase [Chitinophagaceae bacterium]
MKKILLLLLLPVAAKAQQDYTSTLDRFMEAQVAVKKFNGNVLVARSGKVLYQKAFGYRSYDAKTLLDNNSVFELASVSKQFTAMGILILKEKGLLKLSDSLRYYFPELPYYNITLQQMLEHTSGLPAYEEEMEKKWDHHRIAFNKDMIGFLAAEKPAVHFKPGEKWEYSNTAYALLASIIEKVSKQNFKDFMATNIFQPLGMKNSRVYNTRRSLKEVIPDYAYGFVYSDSLKRYVLPDSLPDYDYVIYLDGIQGDGIINSTTGDLLKWDRAIKNHTLIPEATQKEMLSRQSITDTAQEKYYGYGVMLGRNEVGDYALHGGSWPGYYTMLCRYIKDDLTVIVLSNNESNVGMVTGALTYIVTGRPFVMPYVHKAVAIDAALPGKYVGSYSIDNMPKPLKIEFTEKEGKLLYRFENSASAKELKPESKNKFFVDSPADMQFEFETDASGNITRSWFIVHSMKKEMKRSK